MLIALAGKSYVRPHRHPAPKAESYHVVRGEMDVFFFDDAGAVVRHVVMGEAGSGKAFLYRLSASRWHMPLARSARVVYHEVYEGPFVKDEDVRYAPWAPEEGDEQAAELFMARVRREAAALPHAQPGGDRLAFLGGQDA